MNQLADLLLWMGTDPLGSMCGLGCVLALPFTALVVQHRLDRNRRP